MADYILAIDQGTTGSTALVMSPDGSTRGRANREFPQHYPRPGWVEHEPEEIWRSVIEAVAEALESAGVRPADIAAIGIANQRETALIWDRRDDRPVHRAIVWQDRRTNDLCVQFKKAGHEAIVREKTGLLFDPYFAGTKLRWLLDHVEGVRSRAEQGQLACGTVDSYLLWRLAGGAAHSAPHVTDVTNASRTLLMNLRQRAWDPQMCEMLDVPMQLLPRIVASAGDLAKTKGVPGLPDGIPIAGIAGDQHAALFGQACFQVGDSKCTYGTGAFVLVNTGQQPVASRFGLLSTVAWQVGEQVVYAIEGSCFIAGAAVQWLRDGLGLIDAASEIEPLAASVPSSEGVVFVPALAGLGAPHWDAEARGLVSGITRGTTKAHLARAALDAIAFQVNDLVQAMADDLGKPLSRLRVDGGAAQNDLLMQLQANLSDLVVERPSELESTARGAAMLAGVGVGLFETGAEAANMVTVEKFFNPGTAAAEREAQLRQWKMAVDRARS